MDLNVWVAADNMYMDYYTGESPDYWAPVTVDGNVMYQAWDMNQVCTTVRQAVLLAPPADWVVTPMVTPCHTAVSQSSACNAAKPCAAPSMCACCACDNKRQHLQ